jgi:hypothetical protein
MAPGVERAARTWTEPDGLRFRFECQSGPYRLVQEAEG